MARTIDNSDDTIDSRDVIARIAELENDGDNDAEGTTGRGLWELANPDEAAELKALLALASDGENSASDWQHGETLIRDSYFRTYAMDLAEDLHGNALANLSWPMNCIDWDQAARELQMDYSAVEFDGVTYWVR